MDCLNNFYLDKSRKSRISPCNQSLTRITCPVGIIIRLPGHCDSVHAVLSVGPQVDQPDGRSLGVDLVEFDVILGGFVLAHFTEK